MDSLKKKKQPAPDRFPSLVLGLLTPAHPSGAVGCWVLASPREGGGGAAAQISRGVASFSSAWSAAPAVGFVALVGPERGRAGSRLGLGRSVSRPAVVSSALATLTRVWDPGRKGGRSGPRGAAEVGGKELRVAVIP